VEKNQKRYTRTGSFKLPSSTTRPENRSQFAPADLWKARQLREHRRANGLCFKCGEKYVPGHKCPDTLAHVILTQLAATMGQGVDGGGFIPDEMLSALEVQNQGDVEFFLSLNAIIGTQNSKVIHLRALANN
jgi:hypothetical protein